MKQAFQGTRGLKEPSVQGNKHPTVTQLESTLMPVVLPITGEIQVPYRCHTGGIQVVRPDYVKSHWLLAKDTPDDDYLRNSGEGLNRDSTRLVSGRSAARRVRGLAKPGLSHFGATVARD